MIPPSNPVVSIGTILGVPGVADAVRGDVGHDRRGVADHRRRAGARHGRPAAARHRCRRHGRGGWPPLRPACARRAAGRLARRRRRPGRRPRTSRPRDSRPARCRSTCATGRPPARSRRRHSTSPPICAGDDGAFGRPRGHGRGRGPRSGAATTSPISPSRPLPSRPCETATSRAHQQGGQQGRGRCPRTATRPRRSTRESVRVVARRGSTVIAETRHGLVLAAAGVDASNVRPVRRCCCPADPDGSARRIRATWPRAHSASTSRSSSPTPRAAPGATARPTSRSGVPAWPRSIDLRGRPMRMARTLMVTTPAVADEVAALGDLVKGKASGRPAAVVRGLAALVLPRGEHGPGAAALVRDRSATCSRSAPVRRPSPRRSATTPMHWLASPAGTRATTSRSTGWHRDEATSRSKCDPSVAAGACGCASETAPIAPRGSRPVGWPSARRQSPSPTASRRLRRPISRDRRTAGALSTADLGPCVDFGVALGPGKALHHVSKSEQEPGTPGSRRAAAQAGAGCRAAQDDDVLAICALVAVVILSVAGVAIYNQQKKDDALSKADLSQLGDAAAAGCSPCTRPRAPAAAST